MLESAEEIEVAGVPHVQLQEESEQVSASLSLDEPLGGSVTYRHCGCWRRLSNRTKAAVVLGISFLVLAALITGILIPFSGTPLTSDTRTYYIAAVEVEWDFAPFGFNAISGRNFTREEAFFVSNKTGIGSKYVKAVYKQFEDDSFDVELPIPETGILGPIIYAEVGDKIEVVFKNMLSFPCSIYAHGLAYARKYEGSIYNESVKDPSSCNSCCCISRLVDRYDIRWDRYARRAVYLSLECSRTIRSFN